MEMELATPFNRRLVSSTPDPDKMTLSPAMFCPYADQEDIASDEGRLIGDADYLNGLEEKNPRDNKPKLKQKTGARSRKPSVGSSHKEGPPRRINSAPSSSASGLQGQGILRRTVPPHPCTPALEHPLSATTLSYAPYCSSVSISHDYIQSMGVVGHLPDWPSGFVQIGSISGSMNNRKHGSCTNLAEACDPRSQQGPTNAPLPREESTATRGRAILGRKVQQPETATSKSQPLLPLPCTMGPPKCLPSPTELGARSAFPVKPDKSSSFHAVGADQDQGRRKSSGEVSSSQDHPSPSQTDNLGGVVLPAPSAKQMRTPSSQAKPSADGKLNGPIPKHVSPRETEEREADDEVFGINDLSTRASAVSLIGSLAALRMTSPSSPPLCANGSIHRCPPNARFSPTPLPTFPTSSTPPTTSPPLLSPMPFAQAAGEFNSNARPRGRCPGEAHAPSALSQLGEARLVHTVPQALQQPAQQSHLEELNRAIHHVIQVLRDGGRAMEWQQAARELEEAVKGCPYLRPGYLAAELDAATQPWRTQVAQLNRRVKTLNAQLSERERQIKDLRRPASEADREEQNEEVSRLHGQMREAVMKLQEMERQAEIFREENRQLLEERSRRPDLQQKEEELRQLHRELEAAQQSARCLTQNKVQQHQMEREQKEHVLCLSRQAALLKEEKGRLQRETDDIKVRLATMQAQFTVAQEERDRERERRREEERRQEAELQKRLAAQQECAAAQRNVDALRAELRRLKADCLRLQKELTAANKSVVKVEEINQLLSEGLANALHSMELEGSNGCPSSSKSSPLDMLRTLCSHTQPSAAGPSQARTGPGAAQKSQCADGSSVSSLEMGPLSVSSRSSTRLSGCGPKVGPREAGLQREAGQVRGIAPSSSKGFAFLSPSKTAASSPSTSTTVPKSFLDRNALANNKGPVTSSPLQKGKTEEEDASPFNISKFFIGPPYPPSVEKERAGDLAGSPVDDSWDSEFENHNVPKAHTNWKMMPGTDNQENSGPVRPFEGTQLDVSISTIQAETESVLSNFSRSTTTSTAHEKRNFEDHMHAVDQQLADSLNRLKSNNL